MLREQRRFSEARVELDRAHAILARSLPPDHPTAIVFDIYVAQLEDAEGHRDQAVQTVRRVVEATRRAKATSSLRFALNELARMVARSAPRDALPIYDELLRLNLEFKGRSTRHDVETLEHLAEVALEAHRPEAAIAWFDRMPEAAREIPEVRRRLDRAISHRP
jgi:tetratricopeptide (TPR) repeat protein